MNPQMIIQMMLNQNPMMRNNPLVGNAMNMMQGNNVQGLQQLAQNLCDSKGLKLEDVQKQVMQRFGMK